MIKISIDRKRIQRNRENPDKASLPVIAIEYEGISPCIWAFRVNILGPSRVVYQGNYNDEGELGAAWVETESDVEVG